MTKSPHDYYTKLAKLHNTTIFASKDLCVFWAACGGILIHICNCAFWFYSDLLLRSRFCDVFGWLYPEVLQLWFPLVVSFFFFVSELSKHRGKEERTGDGAMKAFNGHSTGGVLLFYIPKNNLFSSLKLPKYIQLFMSVRSQTIGQNDSSQVQLMHLLVSKTWTPQGAGCHSPSTEEWCCLLLWWHFLVAALVLSPAL